MNVMNIKKVTIQQDSEIITTYVNNNLNRIIGEEKISIENSTIKTLSDLYHFGLYEFGKCTSKIYQDTKKGESIHCGYVFSKNHMYSDSNEKYNQLTWLSIS